MYVHEIPYCRSLVNDTASREKLLSWRLYITPRPFKQVSSAKTCRSMAIECGFGSSRISNCYATTKPQVAKYRIVQSEHCTKSTCDWSNPWLQSCDRWDKLHDTRHHPMKSINLLTKRFLSGTAKPSLFLAMLF